MNGDRSSVGHRTHYREIDADQNKGRKISSVEKFYPQLGRDYRSDLAIAAERLRDLSQQRGKEKKRRELLRGEDAGRREQLRSKIDRSR